MTPRVPTGAALALVLVLVACTGNGGSPSPSPQRRATTPPTTATSPVARESSLAGDACRTIDRDVLLRTWRGVRLDRSGDVQIIPIEPNFVSGGLTHATPFDYTQEVPVFLYGPGFVRPGTYDAPITLADVAPTTAALLKFPFVAPDGAAQTQALLPDDERDLPRLVVTLIWDSGGTNVLERWPDSWPYLASLVPHGAWFTNATVGASPSNTPIGHATIGTGAFPVHNGFVDEYMRVNGFLQKPNANGPAFLLEPTLADLYDRAMGNRPKVGAIATLAAHVMMMSHGSQWGGADRDLAVTREKEFGETAGAESVQWNLTSGMAPFYELPSYVNDLPPLSRYVEEVDRADGARDGMWRGNSIEQLSNGFDTPARTPFQQALVERLVERERFGVDDVPDLLYVNYKAIDTIGHLFSADGIEMSDAVATQDAALERFVEFLDRTVGRGEWVMVLAADHGTQPDPEVSGAFQIDVAKLETGLSDAFDDGDDVAVVERVRPSEIWLDRDELRDNGHTLADVSQWLLELTQADTFKNQNVPDPGHENERVFAAALPSSILAALPCVSGSSS
ncbi:MAG TPA: alkaline phosphatase family protein [Actinomycetota bacterium]|nr:alkaline phosphatase family protein [Actinomycetota bacterium]